MASLTQIFYRNVKQWSDQFGALPAHGRAAMCGWSRDVLRADIELIIMLSNRLPYRKPNTLVEGTVVRYIADKGGAVDLREVERDYIGHNAADEVVREMARRGVLGMCNGTVYINDGVTKAPKSKGINSLGDAFRRFRNMNSDGERKH